MIGRKPSFDRLVAAARALEGRDLSDVKSVKVDGQTITDLDAAAAALEQSRVPVPIRGVPDKVVKRLDAGIKRCEGFLEGSKFGRTVKSIIEADPERVYRKLHVEIEHTGPAERTGPTGTADRTGPADPTDRTEHLEVEVMDRRATIALQQVATGIELFSLVPFMGIIAPAIGGLAATVASGVFRLLGRRSLSRALARSAVKQGALAAVGVIPIVGSAVACAAGTVDIRDTEAAASAPNVASIVNLGCDTDKT